MFLKWKSHLTAVLFAVSLPFAAYAQDYRGECKPDFDSYARQIVYVSMSDEKYEYSGTAAWLSPTRIITIGHVIQDVLKNEAWSEVKIRWIDKPYQPSVSYEEVRVSGKDPTITVRARLLKTFPKIDGEFLAVIELDAPIGESTNAVKLPDLDRMWQPLRPGDPVFSVLFAGRTRAWPELRHGAGHVFKQFFPQSSSDEAKPLNSELLWLEMISRPEPRRSRAVAAPGSSGAPIFDCDGNLVGVIAKNLTQNTPLGVLPTAWGVPNIMGMQVDLNAAAELRRMRQK